MLLSMIRGERPTHISACVRFAGANTAVLPLDTIILGSYPSRYSLYCGSKYLLKLQAGRSVLPKRDQFLAGFGFFRILVFAPFLIQLILFEKSSQCFFRVFVNNKPLWIRAGFFLLLITHSHYNSTRKGSAPGGDRTRNRRTGPGRKPGAYTKFRHGGTHPSVGAAEGQPQTAPTWFGPLGATLNLFSFITSRTVGLNQSSEILHSRFDHSTVLFRNILGVL